MTSGSFKRLLENYTPMKIKEFVRDPHNYDVDDASDASGLICPEPTRTQQQFLEEADINYIAERFMRTGEIKQVAHMPTAGDFEGIFDFQDAMNLVVHAKSEFMGLPAKVRSRFDNDPAKLIAFLDDPANREEAIAIGLVARPKPPTIDATPAPDPKPGTPPSVQPGPPKEEKPSK